jgi:Zn-dependent peptidase ImmA (M78 family)
MRIKKTVLKLVRKYKTNCPYQLAEHRNILVQKEPLGSVYGYFHTYRRVAIIHVNCDLDEPTQRFVCAHELGHAILHPHANTPFMKANTFFSVERIEREANEFAAELLIPDEVLDEYVTLQEVAAVCKVPLEITRLKHSK